MLSIDDRRGTGTCPTPFNLASYVLENADAPDDKVALAVLSVSGAERWSYGRLRSEVQRLAGQLRAAGLKPGDRLLLRLSHSPTFPIAFLAAAWCDVLPIPTSTQLTRNELSRIAQESEPTAVLINEDMPLPDHAARVIQVGELPDPQKSADLELG